MHHALRALGVVPALLLLLASLPAHAGVIDADGHAATPPGHPGAIFDDGTNLLWLDATETDGRSLADVGSELGAGGEFEGWRLATRDQLRELFVNAGLDITSTGDTGGWVDDAILRPKVQSFVGIYGQTQPPDFLGAMGTNVWHADTHVDPSKFAAESTLWDLTFSGMPVDRVWVGDNGIQPQFAGLANTDYGVALVMSLPEPSSTVLAATGLLAVVALIAGRRLRIC